MSKSTYPLKLPASVKKAAGLPDFVAGLHVKEAIYTGAQMPCHHRGSPSVYKTTPV
jgi:hypothetical protein